ncbi:hypothetical protein [Pseudoalteromonas ruthenica]|uniref:hypothetical protein n=1 Tax=Pseudoalteromonas ruthenica TaxID=151081 RepID=UPI00241D4F44|nr:hypothetical protein [Pseudoalteromonas ruthenica]|tara:strand:- start:22670 stop:23722 length:1053 start_codon:yes stop_codon:yes gene_type:complete
MDDNKNQELIIVNAISQMVIPTEIFEKSEFKQAINDFKSAQESVQNSLDSVESKRKIEKEGSYIGNWWNNRNEELRDAQLDLNKSIGLLTKQSSDLILFNTAISKVLVSQQKILQEQQELLQKQAAELASQNKCIEKQQVDLSEQQERLLGVNKGLLEAKGITREHAEKLVGCVSRVEIAEQKMELSNQELERSVAACIVAYEERAESLKAAVEDALYNYRQEAAVKLEALNTECNSAIEGLRGQLSNFELKINAESDVRKRAVTSVAQEFNQRIDELHNELEVSHKKLRAELESARESFVSQFTSLSLVIDKRDSEFSQKNKRLLYFSVTTLIVSALSLSVSAYVYFSA